MTWIDNNGEVRPQSWEEYCSMVDPLPEWAISRKVYQPEPLHRRFEDRKGGLSSLRLRLFRANPYCFWCGRAVALHVKHAHPQLATVDHLYSRLHPERYNKYGRQEGVLHVLACYECNHGRSVCEQQGRPFVPKLPERLEFARKADATLAPLTPTAYVETEAKVVRSDANPYHPAVVPTLAEEFQYEVARRQKRAPICTVKEMTEFAKEHPSR